jgi:uncharacterized protein (TIGR04255 family)
MKSANPLPKKLGKPPLVEAIFEIRFEPARGSAGDLLPGLLYAQLGGSYGQIQPLPLSNVPLQIRDADPNLKYAPSRQLVGGNNRRILVGDRVTSISQHRPYGGWTDFRGHIIQLIDVLKSTNLIQTVERYSLKGVNVIPAGSGAQLGALDAKFEIAGLAAPEKGFRFRTEIETGPFLTIVEVATNATVRFPSNDAASGLLLSVDTLATKSATSDLWSNRANRVDEIHDCLKRQFFSLLTDEALTALEPVWPSNENVQ